MSSEPVEELDEIARTAAEVAGAPAPGAVAQTGPRAKKYPEFRPDEWRGHPVAVAANSGAAFLGTLITPNLDPEAASKCNVGESYAFCVDYYADVDMPPWAHALISTGLFTGAVGIAWWANRKAGDAPGRSGGSKGGTKDEDAAAAIRARLAAQGNANPTQEPDEE